MTKKYIIEWIGDFAGAPTFQGGPYGTGKEKQLSSPHKEPAIVQGEEEQDELALNERHGTEIFYRDLSGFPEMNTLTHKKSFVPRDPNEADSQPKMGPTIDGMPVEPDGVDTWKSTKPEYRGKWIIRMNQLVKQEDFIPESFQGTPTNTPGGGTSAWSRATLAQPQDFLKKLISIRTGDINAFNPVGSMGATRHPVNHVPDDKEGKTVQFKEEKLNEATPQERIATFPELVTMGNVVPANTLSQVNNKGLALLATGVLPLQFEQGVKELESELVKYNVPKQQIDAFINNVRNTYKQKLQSTGQQLAQSPVKNIPKPPIMQTPQQQRDAFLATLPMPSPDSIGGLQLYVKNYSEAQMPKEKEILMRNIEADMKDYGEEKMRNYIFTNFSRMPNSQIGKFYSQLFPRVFGKEYTPPQQTMATQAQQKQNPLDKLKMLSRKQ